MRGHRIRQVLDRRDAGEGDIFVHREGVDFVENNVKTYVGRGTDREGERVEALRETLVKVFSSAISFSVKIIIVVVWLF